MVVGGKTDRLHRPFAPGSGYGMKAGVDGVRLFARRVFLFDQPDDGVAGDPQGPPIPGAFDDPRMMPAVHGFQRDAEETCDLVRPQIRFAWQVLWLRTVLLPDRLFDVQRSYTPRIIPGRARCTYLRPSLGRKPPPLSADVGESWPIRRGSVRADTAPRNTYAPLLGPLPKNLTVALDNAMPAD